MPTKYKLYYFKARARGELARMVLGAADQEFDPGNLKILELIGQTNGSRLNQVAMPTGQLPMIEIDGQQLSQSLAIARYLAREYGFAGKSNLDQALVDQVVDTVADMNAEFYTHIYEQDEKQKAEILNKFLDEAAPKFLKVLTKFLELNNNGDRFFVGDSLTIADMAVYDALESLLRKNAKILDSFPKLAANRKLVACQPRLDEYLKNRPDLDL